MWDVDTAALQPAIVEYEEGRASRQRVAFAGMGLLMLAFAAFGVWVIVASHQQYPGGVEAWVGTGFGALFVLLGLAVAWTTVEVRRRIRALSTRERPLLRVDDLGVTGEDGRTVAWADIERLELTEAAPGSSRTNRLAQLDAGHRVSLIAQRLLDRTVGGRFGVRDGTRWVRVVLRDGGDVRQQLTLPVGPARFAAVVTALGEHAAHHGVWIVAPR